MKLGMTLSSEEHGPSRLVDLSQLAEDHGFDFVSVSDHFHPWVGEQGHSPFVWGVLGAIAERTATIEVGVGVTCPLVRIHPAIVAHAAATASRLLGDRFTLGVGTGEALNEHVLGDRWPPTEVRLEMLDEAIDLIRRLWSGDSVTHRGRYYTVENARIFDPPEVPVPIVVSAFGPEAADLAARAGDGLWTNPPGSDIIDRYTAGGGAGPRYGQLTLCWHTDPGEALRLAHRVWPNSGVPGQLSQDLPTTLHFEQAAKAVTPEMVSEAVPCGPDPEPVVDRAVTAARAGIDHLYLHQIGPDQEGFLAFWDTELRTAMTEALDV